MVWGEYRLCPISAFEPTGSMLVKAAALDIAEAILYITVAKLTCVANHRLRKLCSDGPAGEHHAAHRLPSQLRGNSFSEPRCDTQLRRKEKPCTGLLSQLVGRSSSSCCALRLRNALVATASFDTIAAISFVIPHRGAVAPKSGLRAIVRLVLRNKMDGAGHLRSV